MKGGGKLRWSNHLWGRIVRAVTAEWMVTTGRKRRANGGGTILARSLWATVFIYVPSLWLYELIDPANSWSPSLIEARTVVVDTVGWFGAIFAGLYATLYTRFASQWTYLNNVYNQIKSAETRSAGNLDSSQPVAAWKAGFIEDAAELHLAYKPLFASVIVAWSKDDEVEKAFIDNTTGNKERFDFIVGHASDSCTAHRQLIQEKVAKYSGTRKKKPVADEG